MKMKGLLKKVLCLFFCTIFVLSSFVACRNDEDEDYYMKNFDYPEKPLKYKHIRRISD